MINELNNVKLFCTAIGNENAIDVIGKTLKPMSFKDFHEKNICRC